MHELVNKEAMREFLLLVDRQKIEIQEPDGFLLQANVIFCSSENSFSEKMWVSFLFWGHPAAIRLFPLNKIQNLFLRSYFASGDEELFFCWKSVFYGFLPKDAVNVLELSVRNKNTEIFLIFVAL